MHLVIYGPEGSGKGTQAHLLSQKLRIPVYTSGDLVRETAVKEEGLLGNACRKALSEGTYVSDDEMFLLWENTLKSKEAQKGFILDGFPRTVHQAQFLMTKSKEAGYTIDAVIYLSLDDQAAYTRLLKRKRKLYTGSSISHDSPKRISERLGQFRREEKKMIAFFKENDHLITIQGDATREKVFQDILTGLQLL